MGGKEDGRLQGFANGIEEAVQRRVKGGFGGCRSGGADGAKVRDVLEDGVIGRHVASMVARNWGWDG